ncbi:MAG: phosphate/phosphite/phosphonate ABC transporter substrate-binding protein [Christensenellales bacterium]|jgi:phosphonate transport system substrate-binding protein
MKKLLALMMVLVMALGVMGAVAEDSKTIENLTVYFVPSASVEEMTTAAEPLKQMLIDELAKYGYTIKNVEIGVGTDYAVVGEGMISGTIDVGFLPANTYVLYAEDGVDVILSATRAALSVESENFDDWNVEVLKSDDVASGYRSLIYVNAYTEKGAELLEKARAGKLTWDDINNATWALGSTTSGASYVYPSIWINKNFGEGIGEGKKTVADLAHATFGGGYPDNCESVLLGQADIYAGFADTRQNDYASEGFKSVYPEKAAEGKNVFDCLKVIGVTDMIMNDTISVGTAPYITPEFKEALQKAFLSIIETDEGKATVAPYSHTGYAIVDDSDYDGTRAAITIFD